MLIGYARCSNHEQNLDLQRDALLKANCERIFEEKISGACVNRPELNLALSSLRSGDTLVVWRLDRLGRTLKHLIETVAFLEGEGVGFRSLTESIDTSSSAGKLTFHIFCSLAQFERELIRERTKAGLEAARARGRKGGRPRMMDDKRIGQARALLADPTQSVTEVAAILGVARATLYRSLKLAAPTTSA